MPPARAPLRTTAPRGDPKRPEPLGPYPPSGRLDHPQADLDQTSKASLASRPATPHRTASSLGSNVATARPAGSVHTTCPGAAAAVFGGLQASSPRVYGRVYVGVCPICNVVPSEYSDRCRHSHNIRSPLQGAGFTSSLQQYSPYRKTHAVPKGAENTLQLLLRLPHHLSCSAVGWDAAHAQVGRRLISGAPRNAARRRPARWAKRVAATPQARQERAGSCRPCWG